MQYYIQLEWKSFTVKLDKVRVTFKSNLSSNYDGIICDEKHIYIVFFEEVQQADTDFVQNYWATIIASTFYPTIDEIIDGKINGAVQFGLGLITSIAKENVKMGITQANKTKEISDYCRGVARYLREGSLYAAISEIDSLIAAGVSSDLAPFVTTDRLVATKAKIVAYVST